MDCWHFVEVAASGQPILREGEKDILIEQVVGLYNDKRKILNCQKGRVFLTSQRIIYVDHSNPTRNSVCLELDDIESIEYSSKFLRRSARLILFLKGSSDRNASSNREVETVTSSWSCPICMVTNEMEGSLTEYTDPLPICINCGVPADYELIKSSINISKDANEGQSADENSCPACTFINHPQITNCEVCGTRLPTGMAQKRRPQFRRPFKDARVQLELEQTPAKVDPDRTARFVQVSFRKSDGMLFTQATAKSLEDLKKAQMGTLFNKNLVSVDGVPVNYDYSKELPILETKLSKVGIASLESSRENQLLKNDILFNSALTDLNKLMSLVNDIEALYAGHKAKLIGEGKDMQRPLLIIDREKFYNRSSFLDEIARDIYGFAISEFKDNGERIGYGMITLVDLYAMYNKSMRIGTGLISPAEMREACERLNELNLRDLKLTRINGRVLCLASDHSLAFLRDKILSLTECKNGRDLLQLTQLLNEGGSNSWTIGILTEVLQDLIEKGDLVTDEQISGVAYHRNIYWPLEN
ncbi:hypothetical protein HG536_0C02150 [Torulaspora globosa]|uniref:Vacuolar protein-sorting-associated protein 36 n=1 Tax=Torulaspora globosa TaxID=48254 RepID=A0A7G3ZEW0_9SACH|nr:uncharacterized protein HG536_0C02150 [Torulaspora globosa]QLL32046.1 hypothetical protein HG536_0C02150 [Torulaspora globosa]